MRSRPTFARGGIVFPPRRIDNRTVPITNAPVPPVAVVPLRRRGGPSGVCLVREGDRVGEGDPIGRLPKPDALAIHAPIPGSVIGVREVLQDDGAVGPAVVIELGGDFAQSGRPRQAREWKRLHATAILAAAAEAGIAIEGEPLAARLAAAVARGPGVLVANAVETEPWLAAEFRLLADRPAVVAEGALIARAALGCARIVLAVTPDGEEAAALATEAARELGGAVEVVVVAPRHPQEEETRLASALFGREPPRGGSPLDLGAVVLRLSSLAALRDAVVLGRPCFERIVTLGGAALREPRNLRVRVGSRVGDLVDEAGGLASRPAAVVFGRLMNGYAVAGDGEWQDVPVSQETTAIHFLGRREVARGRERPCLRCGRCADTCPWGLVPVRLHELAGAGDTLRAVEEGLRDCTECGCCSYVCPSRIPLAASLRAARRGAA
jgi:Na+-translocating ferredoxin:NAD+ oxidoreductase subunit C